MKKRQIDCKRGGEIKEKEYLKARRRNSRGVGEIQGETD